MEEPRLLLGQHEELESFEKRCGLPEGIGLKEAEDFQREERSRKAQNALAPGDVGVLGKLQRGPRGQDVHDARPKGRGDNADEVPERATTLLPLHLDSLDGERDEAHA